MNNGRGAHARPRWIRAMPVVFILCWASGFPVTRFGLEFIEPFTLLALRSALNVTLILTILPFVRVRWPAGWRGVGHIAVTGFLLQAAYLGCMFIALREGVAQGVAALVAGMQPLLTAGLVGWFLRERVTRRQWAGFLLGFGGLALVLAERMNLGTGTAIGFLFIALTPILITAGSLYQKRFCADMDLRAVMLIQHIVAGTVTFAVAQGLETGDVRWGAEVIFVVAWLVLVLSIGANNLYYLMLRHGEAARVSSLFYLSPPTAVVLGYLTYGETFGIVALIGFAVSVAGVALVTSRPGGATR